MRNRKMRKQKMRNKKYLIMLAIILLIIPILFVHPRVATTASEPTDETWEITGYTEEYENWLKLEENVRKASGAAPRKYKIPAALGTTSDGEVGTTFNLLGYLKDEKGIEFSPTKTGTGWADSSVTSLETNLALKKGEKLDFSESHLKSMTTADQESFSNGGNFEVFANYFTKSDGPVWEDEVTEENKDNLELLNGLTSKAYVTEKIDFRTINKSNPDYTADELTAFRTQVKNHIKNNGSIYAVIDSSKIAENNTLYNTTGDINDAVSIIGWDDNYSKDNFSGSTPENDGAYIALKFDENSNQQIIYISYEDYTVEREMSGIISATTEKDELGENLQVKFMDSILYEHMKKIYSKAIETTDDANYTIEFLGYFRTLGIVLDINYNIVKTQDIYYRPIETLEGLDEFKLERLYANNHYISDITEILSNTNLQNNLYFLELRQNLIDNLNSLKNFSDPKLEKLYYLNLGEQWANVSAYHYDRLDSLKNLEYLVLDRIRKF